MTAYEKVMWIVGGLGILAALVTITSGGKQWKDYGKSLLSMERDDVTRSPGSAAALQERDEEIRQLLDARNALRARRGGAGIDVDRELPRLTAPSIDPALRDEIRDMVIARNYRRARAGQPPLDIEQEVSRSIQEVRGT